MMRWVVGFLLLAAGLGMAQTEFSETPEPRTLRVGIFEKRPYVVRSEAGKWEGLAVDLWEQIAIKNAFDYKFVPIQPETAEHQLAKGEIDVLLGQMSVSPDRERLVDFSQPFLSEPLAGAFRSQTLFPHWMEFWKELPAHGLLPVLAAGGFGLFLFALLFWLVERKVQNSHFSGHPWYAIGSAFWFSAVTMTTVGYGDKTPISPIGRALALVWMLVGILLISAFTATVASTVASSRTSMAVFRLADVARFEVGTMAGSSARTQLRNAGIPSEAFDRVDEALAGVRDGSIGVFVSDFVTIRYELNTPQWKGLRAVTIQNASTQMAFPVRPGLPELEQINVALLDTVALPSWQGNLRRWVGESGPPGS